MNCDESLILISGHLDGTNTEAEEKSLRKHLETCEDCRRLLEQMEENDRLLRESRAEAPADLKDRIMKEVRGGRKNRKPFYISVATSGLAVAAMLTLIFVGKGPAKPQDIPAMAGEYSAASTADPAAVPQVADYHLAEEPEKQKSRARRAIPESGEKKILVIYGAEPEDLAELAEAQPLTEEELKPFMDCAEAVEIGYELPRAQLLDIAERYQDSYEMAENFSEDDFFRSAVLLLAEE